MKALTVRQPWAGDMFLPENPKNIENRRWYTPRRERIAIHVGLTLDRAEYGSRMDFNYKAMTEAQRDIGKIIGTVGIAGCHPERSQECDEAGCSTNRWAQWSDDARRPMWHWRLIEPIVFETPIYSRGALQLWEPSPTVAYLMTLEALR